MSNGESLKLAGSDLSRQRPGSAKGVCIMTIEDEKGVANLVVWPKVMEAYRKVIMQARVIDVRGVVQKSEDVIHVVAHHLNDRSDALERLSNDVMEPPLARADEVKRNIDADHRMGHPRNVRVIPKSRDFH